MTIKTRQGKRGSCLGLQRYLEKDGRALAHDYGHAIGDRLHWGKDMDSSRINAGKDDGRKYYHFILSPDPKDAPTLDALRDLAVAWAKENYPDRQWVIIYHDDNKNSILHAHIALNAYDPVTGGKVHRSDSKVKREARSLNRLKAERGLAVLPDIDYAREKTVQKRKLSIKEIEMREKGYVLWKDRLCDAIETIAPLSSDFTEFQSALHALGIEVYANKRGQLVYVPPDDWKGYPCKDVKLGSGYSRECLTTLFKPDLSVELNAWDSHPSFPREMPRLTIPGFKQLTYADLIERRFRPYRNVRIKNLVRAFEVLRSQKVESSSALCMKLSEVSISIESARAEIDKLEEKQTSLIQAIERIDILIQHETLWDAYSQASSRREKSRIEKSYPETMQACREASEYLLDRGIETKESHGRLKRLTIENQSHIESVRYRLTEAEHVFSEIKSTMRTIENVNDYCHVPLRSSRKPIEINATAVSERPLRSRSFHGLNAGAFVRVEEGEAFRQIYRANRHARNELHESRTFEASHDNDIVQRNELKSKGR